MGPYRLKKWNIVRVVSIVYTGFKKTEIMTIVVHKNTSIDLIHWTGVIYTK